METDSGKSPVLFLCKESTLSVFVLVKLSCHAKYSHFFHTNCVCASQKGSCFHEIGCMHRGELNLSTLVCDKFLQMWLPEAAAQSWHRMNTLLLLHQFCAFTRTQAHVYFLQSCTMHNLPLEQNRHGYTHTHTHPDTCTCIYLLESYSQPCV